MLQMSTTESVYIYATTSATISQTKASVPARTVSSIIVIMHTACAYCPYIICGSWCGSALLGGVIADQSSYAFTFILTAGKFEPDPTGHKTDPDDRLLVSNHISLRQGCNFSRQSSGSRCCH